MIKERGSGRVGTLLQTLYFPVVAVLLALAIGAVFITLMGFDWIYAYESMIVGSLGGKNAIAETMVKAIPLIFTGLSFAVGKRCGLINLGAEGQVYMGGLFSAFIGLSLPGLPAALHIPVALIFGALGGGLLGLLTGWLKNRFGASELITGIMFNYIAIQLANFFVTGPLKEVGKDFPQTALMAESAQLPRILAGTRLHAGFLLALLCILFYYIFLWKTTKGYELRLVGLNAGAAEYAGMNVGRNALLAMFLAGAFAGLAGSSEILGVQLRLYQNFSPNYGFDGIAVALLGGNTPLGVLLSGLLFGVLRSGSNNMQMNAQVPVSVVQIIQSLVILFVVGREMFHFTKRFHLKRSVSTAAKGGG